MEQRYYYRYRLVRPFGYVVSARRGEPIIGELYLERFLVYDDAPMDFDGNALLCNTLEPPFRSSGSYIPTGEYELVYTYSPKFRKKLPRLKNVRGRSGILIHSGNTEKDTLGCILVGWSNGISRTICQSRGVLEDVVCHMKEYRIDKIVIEENLPF